jgi:hypothetical protein
MWICGYVDEYIVHCYKMDELFNAQGSLHKTAMG